MLARYARGTPPEEAEILTQFVGMAGWHRDHARAGTKVTWT
jgi:hypothetical protein